MLDPVVLTQDLIRCESVTPHEGGAITLLESILAEAGFDCHRLRFEDEAVAPVENLFARFGKDSPHFCFAGHSDVVPAGDADEWKYPPFSATIENGKLYGRGAEDMKAAIAAFVTAATQFSQHPFTGSVSLMITGDEEGIAVNGTKKILQWMRTNSHVPDVCVVGEPTNPQQLGEMIKIGRRGSINSQLTIFGKQGHVAYPHLADNPATSLVEILHRLKSHPLDIGTEFFPPSNMEVVSIDIGNPSNNVIPARATARFNIRFNDLHSGSSLTEWIESVCKESGARYEFTPRISGEAFLTQPGAFSDLVSEAVMQATGKTPELSTTGGTSDARFIKDYCPVVEFGATGRTPHMVDEYIEISDIRTLTDIYAKMLQRYFSRA